MRSFVTAAMVALLVVPAGASADEPRAWPHVFQGLGGGAHLGVQLDDVGADDVERLKLREERGARVTAVTAGSPAEKAGIREDDVVTTFDGEVVRSASQLARLVRETPPGRTVGVEVSRDGVRKKLEAELGARGATHLRDLVLPTEPPARLRTLPDVPLVPRPQRPEHRRLGIGYRDLEAADATRLKLARPHGVLVTSLEPGSAAGSAGVRVGDVIVAVDGENVAGGMQLRHRMRGSGPMILSIWRDGETREITVHFDTPEGGRKM